MVESKKSVAKSPMQSASLGDEHERLGRAATEIISAYARQLDTLPVTSDATPQSLEKLFDEPLPINGISSEEIFSLYQREIAPHVMQIPSPRYYGLFNPTPLPIAVWADVLASAINQNGAAWRNSPSASMVEARVLAWLCELVGYRKDSFGTLTSGGSEANLIGLKCARDRAHTKVRDEGVRAAPCTLIVYASERCDYSLEKSVDILGLGRKSLRKIETDDNYHINTAALRNAIASDNEAGNISFCIAGAAGGIL